MSSVWVLLLFMCSKSFSETVSEEAQDAGVWLILLSCIIEYSMLIMFLSKMAWEFWKSRSLMLRMHLKKSSSSLIVYEHSEAVAKKQEVSGDQTDNRNQLTNSLSKIMHKSYPKPESSDFDDLSQSGTHLNSPNKLTLTGGSSTKPRPKRMLFRTIFQKK